MEEMTTTKEVLAITESLATKIGVYRGGFWRRVVFWWWMRVGQRKNNEDFTIGIASSSGETNGGGWLRDGGAWRS